MDEIRDTVLKQDWMFERQDCLFVVLFEEKAVLVSLWMGTVSCMSPKTVL
jgi:hypothetical protein